MAPWCGCDAGAAGDEPKLEGAVCAWCGDPLVTAGSLPSDKILRDGNDFYHDYCAEESTYAEADKLDHAWRQVHETTDEQLRDRLAALREGAEAYARMMSGKAWASGGLYRLDQLREFHAIESELYCRENNLVSKPGTKYSVIPSPKVA